MQTFRNGSYCHVNHLRLLFLTISGIFLTRTSSPFPAASSLHCGFVNWVSLTKCICVHVHLYAILECKVSACNLFCCSMRLWRNHIRRVTHFTLALWIYSGMTKEIIFRFFGFVFESDKNTVYHVYSVPKLTQCFSLLYCLHLLHMLVQCELYFCILKQKLMTLIICSKQLLFKIK